MPSRALGWRLLHETSHHKSGRDTKVYVMSIALKAIVGKQPLYRPSTQLWQNFIGDEMVLYFRRLTLYPSYNYASCSCIRPPPNVRILNKALPSKPMILYNMPATGSPHGQSILHATVLCSQTPCDAITPPSMLLKPPLIYSLALDRYSLHSHASL